MAARDIEEVVRFDAIEGWPAPEAQEQWFGDFQAEQTLLGAYRGGRMHHAWLIGGPKGIGKATLAYRFARFALAYPDPKSEMVGRAADLSVPVEDPAFRKVAARAHPNLLVLERPYDEEKKRYRTELTVPEIRRTVSFFGSTAAEAGLRIAIVDPADDMNANAANALLKVLEEPPARSLFLIIGHAPGRLLPTIRSRCRRLELSPLPAEKIFSAIGVHGAANAEPADLGLAAALAEGSLRRAILLLEEGGIEQYRQLAALLGRVPDIDVDAMHRFADSAGSRSADDNYLGFLELIRGWLVRRIRREAEPEGGLPAAGVALERWAEVWEKVNNSSDLANALNLDRKQVVLSIFMTLARATRM